MGLKIKRLLFVCALVGLLPSIASAATSSAASERLKRAQVLANAKDWAGVSSTLSVGSDSLGRDGLALLARAFAEQHDALNQIRVLQMLANAKENDHEALTMLADAYLKKSVDEESNARMKDLESAAENFRAAIEALKEKKVSDRRPFEGLLETLRALNDRFEARSLLADMIKKFGERPPYLSALCQLYWADGFIDKASESCREAIVGDAKIPENHVYLGLSLRDREDPAQAQKILDKAAKQFPASEFAQWAAGQIAFDRKNFALSHKYFLAGTRADAWAVRSWVGAGRAAIELEQNQDALDALAEACALDRQALPDLRKAAGVLRQRKLFDWTSKFEAQIMNCGTKTRKK